MSAERSTQAWKEQHDFSAGELLKYDFLYKVHRGVHSVCGSKPDRREKRP
ncbi:hypothetical protein MK139_11660 [bacterium]|nr:hypothetical protein [bacterium]